MRSQHWSHEGAKLPMDQIVFTLPSEYLRPMCKIKIAIQCNSFHVQCEGTIPEPIIMAKKTLLRMGIMHSYASLQWRQPDKMKTHNHGMKYAVITNRGNPPNPGTRKHWRVHPARPFSMFFVHVGVPSCATPITPQILTGWP